MPKKIFLIEDDQDIINVMTYALENEGYEIISRDSAEAWREVAQILPALILTDNQLKDGFGTEVCKNLKNDPATAHLPVILVSASTDIETMAAASFADGLLKQPFDFEELISLVKKFLP